MQEGIPTKNIYSCRQILALGVGSAVMATYGKRIAAAGTRSESFPKAEKPATPLSGFNKYGEDLERYLT